jgi:hypothetical protein
MFKGFKICHIRAGLATPPQVVPAHPLRQYAQQLTLYVCFVHGVAHFMPHDGMVPCHLPHAKPRPVLGYFERSPPFFTPGGAQVLKASDQRARVLTLQVNRPSSPIGPKPVLFGCISRHVPRKPSAQDMPFSVSPPCRRPGATHSADTSAIVQTCCLESPCLSRHYVHRVTHRGVHNNLHMHGFRPAKHGPQIQRVCPQ